MSVLRSNFGNSSDYLQATGKVARLRSPVLNPNGKCNSQLEFWYHAFGKPGEMGSLVVQLQEVGSNDYVDLWTYDDVSANMWKKVSGIGVPTENPYQV